MTGTSLEPLFAELFASYGDLECTSREDGRTVITGPYALDASYDGIRLAEDFDLQLTIPANYPKSLPRARELSGIIAPSYEHLFVGGDLCLGVQGELLIAQLKDPSLVRLYDGPVRSYLYSYLFHERYGRYPFEDRAHGTKGILQFYSEFFGETDPIRTWRLLMSTCTEEYRGHLPCPCGSGIAGRKCHGDAVLRLKRSGAISGAKDDLKETLREFSRARAESEKRRLAFKEAGIDLNVPDPIDVFFRQLLA